MSLPILLVLLCQVPAVPAEESTPAPTQVAKAPRPVHWELSAGGGILGSGYTHSGGRFGELLFGPAVDGRLVWNGLTADAALLYALPANAMGAQSTLNALARAGYTAERWSLVAGAVLSRTQSAQPPSQWLPSARLQLALGEWGLSAGLFDYFGQVPFHLSASVGPVELGYAAPLGAVLTARVRVSGNWGVKVSALAFRLGNAELAMVTVSGLLAPREGTP